MLGYVHVQRHACLRDVCTRRSKSTSGVLPQVPPTLFFFFLSFWDKVTIGLGVVRESRLAGQGPLRIPVSTPYPRCWDYKHVLLNAGLLHNFREQSHVLVLAKQASTLPTAISPRPYKRLWSSLFFDLITRKLWELRNIDMSVLWQQKPRKK